MDLWHKRLGHPFLKISKLIPQVSRHRDINVVNKACEVCFRAKQTREKFPLSQNKASSAFELIHCDLWGAYQTPSTCGAFYFLTIIDDYSRAVWVYLLTDKREVSTMLHNFLALVERQFNKQVKIFRSDNGTEFICMRKYFLDHGIIFQTSCTGTPQQNERVERKHRHILNVARALQFQGNLPIKFWGEYILTVGYLINRTPSTILNGKTPYEMLHGQQPEYEHLKIIGSLCYAHNQRRDGDKFASRSKKCVFIGYPYGKKGWKLFDLETEFPFALATTSRKDALPNNWNFAESVHDAIDDIDETDHTLSIQRSNDMGVENIRSVLDVGIEAGTSQYTNIDETMLSSTTSTTSTNEKVDDQDANPQNMDKEDTTDPSMSITEPMLGRGHRIKQPSTRLQHYVTNTARRLSSSNCSLQKQPQVHPIP